MNQLIAYVLDGHEVRIRLAPLERQWMDDSDQRFAYRCLPLNIANAHGWEILCTAAFSAVWDGRRTNVAIRIKTGSGTASLAVSHFGSGILTFYVPCLFRTDPGVDLFVTGPINRTKDAIAPLSGVVETDWSPYTFTMNWQFTRPGQRVHFEVDEPFCECSRRGEIESVVPSLHRLSEIPSSNASTNCGRRAAIPSIRAWPIQLRRLHRTNGRRRISEARRPRGRLLPRDIAAVFGCAHLQKMRCGTSNGGESPLRQISAKTGLPPVTWPVTFQGYFARSVA